MNSFSGWQWVSCLNKSPARRTEEDISIIFSKMKSLKVFEQYPENILHELSRYALHDTFLANTTLYRPGETGNYWYAVISGTLEVLDVDLETSKTTSLCQLSMGDSFGEEVIFGTCRQTQIESKEYCELLQIEAIHIQRIYQSHQDVMDILLRAGASSGSSTSPEPDDVSDGTGRDSMERTSELAMAGYTLHQLIKDHFKELISDHKVHLHTYKQCCSGSKLVDWMMKNSTNSRTRVQVVQMWQALLAEGIIQHVNKEHPFRDEAHLFYRFVDLKREISLEQRRWSISSNHRHSHCQSQPHLLSQAGERGSTEELTGEKLSNGRPRSQSSFSSSPRSSRGSLLSLLEECFDTIAALGPDVLIYATLRKDPSERSEEDIELIYEELLHIRALRHLSNAVKRQISACANLEYIKKVGKYLYHQGDKGKSWYVILQGSVSLIIEGKGVVCTLHEGDEFGKLGVISEALRSSSVQVREDNCYFLRIEREDFRRILLSVESTTIKFTEHGKEVLLLEKATLGRYLVVKGRPENMLSHLLDSEIERGSQEDTFAEDFFLTHPAFMTTRELCEQMRKVYHGEYDKKKAESGAVSVEAGEEQDKLRKRRVADAVCIWLKTSKAEVIKDQSFLKLLANLQDSLEKDGLKLQLTSLSTYLAESMKSASSKNSMAATHVASSQFSFLKLQNHRSKSIATNEHEIKMGISLLPSHQHKDKTPLRVHTVDRQCCRLQVSLDATARSIVCDACQKLGLKEFLFNLCEVKSSGEAVKIVNEDVSVHSSLSVNGRLFVVPKKDSPKHLEPLPDQNLIPVATFPEKESSRDIAIHLTMYDWNLFVNIQQMEYIYHMFGRHKFGRITTNLDALVNRFNEVQYWVVTEIVREPDLVKRVTLIKKFIKIAGYCKSFNNLNSFLAITIGLMNGAVSRLRETWKEVPIRTKNRLEQFQALTDPSRNHSVLRSMENKLAPPVIPFMPLVTKDAYFLHIGNETFVGELVNFEKMRLVASSVRKLSRFKSGAFPQELKLTANKNPALQQYIRSLRVMDNEVQLTQMSHKIESSSRPVNSSS